MFERHTEEARRVIFFARYEASQLGSPSIESHHLLLGLLREDKDLVKRLMRPESIRQDIESMTEVRPRISTTIDLPLSQESKRILASADQEAERLNHKRIGREHLLLGILREESCVAARVLRERGLRLDAHREEMPRGVAESQLGDHTLELKSDVLVEMLDLPGFATVKEHLVKAMGVKTSGDLKTAQTELRLFLDSLVDAIHVRKPDTDVLSPIFEGFDWRTSVQGLRSGLSDDEDWKFRFWLTLLLAELLLDRYLKEG
jgi:hypothetical protein